MNNKRILIIEDEGAIIEHLKKRFNNEVEFIEAYSYLSAMGNWNKYNGQFDCLIIDLQISIEGLDEKKGDEYYPLIGLAFIEDICDNFKNDIQMELLNKMVIYSGFVNQLKNGNYSHKKWILDHVICISKECDSINTLVEKVNEIIL